MNVNVGPLLAQRAGIVTRSDELDGYDTKLTKPATAANSNNGMAATMALIGGLVAR